MCNESSLLLRQTRKHTIRNNKCHKESFFCERRLCCQQHAQLNFPQLSSPVPRKAPTRNNVVRCSHHRPDRQFWLHSVPTGGQAKASLLLHKLGCRSARPVGLRKCCISCYHLFNKSGPTNNRHLQFLHQYLQKVEDVPNKCTHINYAFAGVDAKSFKLKSLGPASGDGSIEDFLRLRQLSPTSSLLLSVGGWAEGGRKYSDLVSSKESRKKFIDSVIETMERYKEFDGLDLDWEYPGATDREGKYADKENFLKLVQELRKRFDEYGNVPASSNSSLQVVTSRRRRHRSYQFGRKLELSMAVPVAKFRLQEGYEVYELCQLMDFVNLMTYDLRGNWAGVSGNKNKQLFVCLLL